MSEFQPITQNVTGLQFSIMSPEEIRKNSVVEITKHETYDKDIPVIKGLFDLRMGTTDMGKVCNTCHLKNTDCPGHFGHIELAMPIYSFHFADIIVKTLKCICFRCAKLRIDTNSVVIDNIRNKSNRHRSSDIYELSSKITRCGQVTEDGCGCLQPTKYKMDGISGIQITWKEEIEPGKKTQHIRAEYVKALFEKITDEDATLLGFSPQWCRPEWLICSVLPVPPPAVRPSVKQGNSQRMDDDITHKLSDIVKYNNSLKAKMKSLARPEIIEDWYNMVVYHVVTMIDNELPGIYQSTHRSGRPLKAIRQRLKGKEGRLRSNLMGKRVDFSARSVITPDPNIDLDQLGVPMKIAMNLTFPETANKFNIERLKAYVQNGSAHWPGAKSIIKQKGKVRISVNADTKDTIVIELGDKVNRHLIDGDWVLFNRQPSLHKMSMMGHRVKVMEGDTFRLNISVTPPYNADFDGDEMNMHVPQSMHSVSELINIASVNNQIISPRENKPIITIVQDTLLGIYKLTHSEVIEFPEGSSLHQSSNTNLYDVSNTPSPSSKCVHSCIYTKKQMINIVSDLSTYNGRLPEPDYAVEKNGVTIPLWSGKTVLSYIIPENVNLKMSNGSYDDVKLKGATAKKDQADLSEKSKQLVQNNETINIVSIVNGLIQHGTFDKSLFSKTSKGLIHTIFNDLGPERTNDFINDLQKIVSYILLIEGFSVGISDMIADENTNQKISETIRERKSQIEEITQEFHLGIFEGFPGQSNQEYFESRVNSILNKIINDTGKIGLANLDPKNRATFMINSGSKGKSTNIAQMIACLGQQNVDGRRIPYGFNDRTLPHYQKYDDSSEARGFVENSFISGQTPQEFFFHAMGGREGIIDTAVKTSATGYIQRKLVKAMEDLMVGYDYSVRSSSGTIIQFIYGNDGMDATFVESQPIYLTQLDTDKLVERFSFPEISSWPKILEEKAVKKLKKSRGYKKRLQNAFMKLLEHREYLMSVVFARDSSKLSSHIFYPIHIQRIIENTVRKKSKSDISPLEILKGNQKLISRLFIREDFKNNKMLEILIDVHLNPTILISEYRITKAEYDVIIQLITDTFYKSRISPGEMVGALAAQSIGEPATQMTLNTFHFAGVSAKSNVTRGIPRLRELLHVSKNIKSPSTTIYLKDEFAEDPQKANYVKNNLEYILLRDIIVSSSIYYDPDNNIHETNIQQDKHMLEIYQEFLAIENGDDQDYDITAPWIIRLIFDKEKMMEKGIVMEDIYIKLMDYDSERILFTFADDNCKELIGRISLKVDPAGSSDTQGIQDQTDIISIFKNINEDIMHNIAVKGIPNIEDIVVSDIKGMEKVDHTYKYVNKHILETDGTNLIKIMNNPYVDNSRVFSNDIIEMYEVLGIEAARTILIQEITDVVDHAGEYINNRHIELLCDTMTSKGELTSINRQGINRGDVGPLAKCSFEDTTDQLIKSGIFSEKDNLTGVSSNIMMGQTIKSGTGICNLLLDEKTLKKELKSIGFSADEFMQIDEDNIDVLMEMEDEGECGDNDFKFSFE